MSETTLTTIEQTVRIDASPDTVWRLWTDPELLTTWLVQKVEVVLEPGGRFRGELREGPVFDGEFVELDRPSRLVFTFGWEGNDPGTPLAPGSTRVEVTLVPDGGGTLVTLRHLDMPESHAADHRQGWNHFLVDELARVAPTTR
jgi:uncharacterized protein YndB with AHSA1/START domain